MKITCGNAPWNKYIHSRTRCEKGTCKYPETCKHHDKCMEKLVLEAEERRNNPKRKV